MTTTRDGDWVPDVGEGPAGTGGAGGPADLYPRLATAASGPPALELEEASDAARMVESHCHTPLCGHASGTIDQYAGIAQRRGLAGIIVTCHNPMPDGYAAAMRMREDQFDSYLASVAQARRNWAGCLDIRLGLEADYVPGCESYVEKQLARADFDFVLGSVHPQIPEYRARYFNGRTADFQKTYFQHLADAAETALFDSLAHPDMVKFLMPSSWNGVFPIIEVVRQSLDRIAATGIAMEFNTSGWCRPMAEPSPGPRLLREMATRGIPVTLGADAHSPQRVGDRFRRALRHLHVAGYRHISVFKNRRPQRLEIKTVHNALPSFPRRVRKHNPVASSGR